MNLFDALTRTSRLCALFLAIGQGVPTFATSAASVFDEVTTLPMQWSSPASSSELETAIHEAIRELRLSNRLLPRLELCLGDGGVRSYLRELGAILDVCPADPAELAASASSLAFRLAAARTTLINATESSAVWLAIATTIAPNAGPFLIPAHLVKSAVAGPPMISIELIDDVLMAQEALALPVV